MTDYGCLCDAAEQVAVNVELHAGSLHDRGSRNAPVEYREIVRLTLSHDGEAFQTARMRDLDDLEWAARTLIEALPGKPTV